MLLSLYSTANRAMRCAIAAMVGITLAALVVLAGSASASSGPRPSLKVTPSTVVRGHRITLSGSTGTSCPAGSQVTIYSSAFTGKPTFNGFPTVVTRSAANHAFSVRAKTLKSDRPGSWGIFARCAGKKFATVYVNVTK